MPLNIPTAVLLTVILLSLLLNPVQGFTNPQMSMPASGMSKNPSPTLVQRRNKLHERRKEDWINRSVNYYRKVMREDRRRLIGQLKDDEQPEQQQDFVIMAKKHYFAKYKIKNGMPHHAERIYRRIIDELSQEEEGQCDHAKLAVTTLLLALLLQRMGDLKGTRAVFLNFFRVAVMEMEEDEECACSAKVLQAYGLFEMKRGNSLKSLDLVTKAIKLDKSLAPILNWKQFRDALARQDALDKQASLA